MQSEQPVLSSKEAYNAMVALPEAYFERTQSDDVGALLGDLQLDQHDEPYDPAMTDDWIRAVARVIEEGGM